jgi:hypothetical protein
MTRRRWAELLAVGVLAGWAGCSAPAGRGTGDAARDVPAEDAPAVGIDVHDATRDSAAFDAEPAEPGVLPDVGQDLPAATTDAPDTAGQADAVARPVRFAVVSDTHIVTDPTDPANVRFASTLQGFGATDPVQDLVIDTGDNVDALFCTPDVAQAYLDGGDPIPMLDLYRQTIVANTSLRYQVVLGNHDDRYLWTYTDKTVPKAAWLKEFAGTGMLPTLYYAFDEGGCQFVVLDSTDLAYDQTSNDSPTFGPEQLAWLDGLLGRGLPSVVFWHHWIPQPDPAATDADLNPVMPVLRRHADVVKATFTGHQHEFRKYRWEGIDFYQTTSLRYSTGTAWHLAACDAASGTVTILNAADLVYQTGPDPALAEGDGDQAGEPGAESVAEDASDAAVPLD